MPLAITSRMFSGGGQLILLRPTDHLQTLFRITKLNTIFHISAEEAQAVRSARTDIFETAVRAIPENSTVL
jgi:anti-anti-sigma regulatory factor